MTTYAVTELLYPGASDVWVWDVNDAGVVAGGAVISPGSEQPAFLFDPSSGQFTDIGSRGDARKVNSSGQCVGAIEGAAFFYDKGTVTDPSAPLKFGVNEAYLLNDAGDVVGWAQPTDKLPAGMYWLARKGEVTNLDPLLSPFTKKQTYAVQGLNNQGQGQLLVGYGDEDGFVYDLASNQATQLPAGLSPWHFNDFGAVVGVRPSDNRLFFYQDGEISLLEGEPDPNGLGFMPGGINNDGNVVGTRLFYKQKFEAVSAGGVIWVDGILSDLNDHVPPAWKGKITDAMAIGDKGHIVANIENTSGTGSPGSRGLLVTPPPDLGARLAGVKAALHILFGIIQDAPGFGYTPGGHGRHVGPGPGDPGPVWSALRPAQRDLLMGYSLDELATLIASPKSRRDVRRVARDLMQNAAGRIAAPPASVPTTVGAVTRSRTSVQHLARERFFARMRKPG